MKLYKIGLLSFLLFFGVQTVWAQTSPREQRKLERAEKKRLKEEALLRNQDSLMAMVEEKAFVLEASVLSGRYNQVSVSSGTNFILVEGDKIVVQTANNHGIRYNGLGGVTIQGSIRKYELTEEKSGVNMFVEFYDPVLGFSTLNMNIQQDGRARATVYSHSGGRVSFQGQVVALEKSRVFKGRTII